MKDFMKHFDQELLIGIAASIICVGMISACSAGGGNDSGENPPAVATQGQGGSQADDSLSEHKRASDKEVLWDFRKADYREETFSQAETDAVVNYLFADQADKKIEIRNRLSGSFTKPNAKETLYYLTGCKDEDTGRFTTDCPHSSWDSVAWIAIFDGTKPVIKISEALGSSIEKITDVNGDGKNEFLSFGGYAQSGMQTMGAALGEISDGKYKKIKGFDGYAFNCAWGPTLPEDKKMVRAVVISYTPTADGGMPDFFTEYFQAGCKDDAVDESSWKKITQKAFDDFFDSLS